MPFTASDYIARYRTYLEGTSEQELLIPEEFSKNFWNWFNQKAILFEGRKVIGNPPDPKIDTQPIHCFINTFRCGRAFVKRYIYFEGFTYSSSTDEYVRHAFNTNKGRKVYDFTLKGEAKTKYDKYVGVKIPLAFVWKIYKHYGYFINAQYSMLVSFFLFKSGFQNYQEYANL
jgi:hypothetical protein